MTEPRSRPAYGILLRQWRERRRISQLELSLEAAVSARHLSFVETGRARPSRDMVLRLAERLDVPLRDRNSMLHAAGFAPLYEQRPLTHPDLAPIRGALDRILVSYLPCPALVIDRAWNLVAANSSLSLLTLGVSAELLQPPVNVLRLSLHPRGLAERIENLAQWRTHLLDRLAHEIPATGDAGLASLHQELADYPGGRAGIPRAGLGVPLIIRSGERRLSLLSTVTTFCTAVDVTVAELRIEAFLPADEETAEILNSLSCPEAAAS